MMSARGAGTLIDLKRGDGPAFPIVCEGLRTLVVNKPTNVLT